ncbi:hypothetical protein AX14_010650, partial [Amanita brunnescens Koide BX004]
GIPQKALTKRVKMQKGVSVSGEVDAVMLAVVEKLTQQNKQIMAQNNAILSLLDELTRDPSYNMDDILDTSMDRYGDWSEQEEEELHAEAQRLKLLNIPKLAYVHKFPTLLEEELCKVWEHYYRKATLDTWVNKWGTRTRVGMEAMWETESEAEDVDGDEVSKNTEGGHEPMVTESTESTGPVPVEGAKDRTSKEKEVEDVERGIEDMSMDTD